jgi:hypothetical protein
MATLANTLTVETFLRSCDILATPPPTGLKHCRAREWVPEALKELLSEAGVRNIAVYHLKDDIQAPEYVEEGVAELGGREIPVSAR